MTNLGQGDCAWFWEHSAPLQLRAHGRLQWADMEVST